jgi:hypothetical protein
MFTSNVVIAAKQAQTSGDEVGGGFGWAESSSGSWCQRQLSTLGISQSVVASVNRLRLVLYL